MRFNPCPLCAHRNPVTARSCEACGVGMVAICARCETVNDTLSLRCQRCDAVLPAGEADDARADDALGVAATPLSSVAAGSDVQQFERATMRLRFNANGSVSLEWPDLAGGVVLRTVHPPQVQRLDGAGEWISVDADTRSSAVVRAAAPAQTAVTVLRPVRALAESEPPARRRSPMAMAMAAFGLVAALLAGGYVATTQQGAAWLARLSPGAPAAQPAAPLPAVASPATMPSPISPSAMPSPIPSAVPALATAAVPVVAAAASQVATTALAASASGPGLKATADAVLLRSAAVTPRVAAVTKPLPARAAAPRSKVTPADASAAPAPPPVPAAPGAPSITDVVESDPPSAGRRNAAKRAVALAAAPAAARTRSARSTRDKPGLAPVQAAAPTSAQALAAALGTAVPAKAAAQPPAMRLSHCNDPVAALGLCSHATPPKKE